MNPAIDNLPDNNVSKLLECLNKVVCVAGPSCVAVVQRGNVLKTDKIRFDQTHIAKAAPKRVPRPERPTLYAATRCLRINIEVTDVLAAEPYVGEMARRDRLGSAGEDVKCPHGWYIGDVVKEPERTLCWPAALGDILLYVWCLVAAEDVLHLNPERLEHMPVDIHANVRP